MEKVVKRLIQQWSGVEWQEKGFREHLRRWLLSGLTEHYKQTTGEELDQEDQSDVRSDVDDILNAIGGRIPDLFRFEGDLLEIIEIEDTSPLKQDKLWQYCLLWNNLDCYDLHLRLIVTDRYGVNPTEIPLLQFYLSFMTEAVQNKGNNRP